jgi:ribosome-associated protein
MSADIYAANNDLRVNARLTIPRDELVVQASKAGGPGGQHVNTSSTRIEVRWNVESSRALSEADRARLRTSLAGRIDTAGMIRVTASESRSQRRNRDFAEERLADLVRRALVIPKTRKKTKKPRGAVEARLQQKRERAGRKKDRRRQSDD